MNCGRCQRPFVNGDRVIKVPDRPPLCESCLREMWEAAEPATPAATTCEPYDPKTGNVVHRFPTVPGPCVCGFYTGREFNVIG